MQASPPPSTAHEGSGLPGRVAAVLLVAGAIAVVLAGVQSTLFDLDRHTVPKELVLHLTALALLAVMLPRWRDARASVVTVLAAASLGWSALSAVFAANHWLAWRALGVSTGAFVIYLGARLARQAGLGGTVTTGLGLSALLAALLGLAQAWGLDLAIFSTERMPGGSFGNRNFLAHYVTIGLPVVAGGALLATRAWTRWSLATSAALMLGTVVLTRSRASWLAVMASAVVVLLLASRHRTRGVLGPGLRSLVVTSLAGVSLVLLLPNRLDWASSSPYRDTVSNLVDRESGSGRGRLIQYRHSLELVKQDPLLGVGPGNWFVEYPRVTRPGDPSFAGADPIPTNPWPSSDWVALLTERGIVGTLLVLLMGAAALGIAARRAWDPDHPDSVGGVVLAGTLVATLVTGTFDAVLHLAAPGFLTAGLTGALLPETGAVVDRPLSRKHRVGGSLLAAAVALLFLLNSTGQFVALRITREDTGRAAIERALRYDPGSFRLHLRLAYRGSCRVRLPHAEAARRLMPHHAVPKRLVAACRGRTGGGGRG